MTRDLPVFYVDVIYEVSTRLVFSLVFVVFREGVGVCKIRIPMLEPVQCRRKLESKG